METPSSSKKTSMIVVGFVWAVITINAFESVTGVIGGKGSVFNAVLLVALSFVCMWLNFRLFRNYKQSLAKETVQAENQLAFEAKRDEFIQRFAKNSEIKILPVTYLGGSGFDGNAGEHYLFCKKEGAIALADTTGLKEYRFKIEELQAIEITGPGTQTTNAGLVGGGFGIEGMLKGMVVASVLNTITSKSNTNTFIKFLFLDKEVYFHLDCIEPAELRMALSSIFVQLENSRRKVNNSSVSDELVKLHSLLKNGVLTQDEFDTAKRNLLEG